MRVVSCLLTQHDLRLVLLAAVVCVAGSLITFGLYERTRARSGLQMHGWAFLTAVAAGSSVWCTHFIAMLAYKVSAPVAFDPMLTMASLVIAIGGCGLGFGLSAMHYRFAPPEVCGAVVGMGIALMHYTGMAAYHVEGLVEWDGIYIAASIWLAGVGGAFAIDQAVRQPYPYSRFIAPVAFVLTVVVLHFTGMAAVQVTPLGGGADDGQAFDAIAVAVAGVGLMIIGTGIASYLIDRTSAQESLARLEHMALNDALTGLPNRVHFADYLALEIERAREAGTRLAVIGIDLDRFKEINDHHGHEAGDRALKIIGQRLAKLIDQGEFIARIGGDEFAAVKRFKSEDDVHDFLSRLEDALKATLHINDFTAMTGGSIGVALFPDDGDDAARLITNADLAMYRAKSEHRSNGCFYDRSMDEAARERSLLATELRSAASNGEFELHYQVQNAVSDGAITGHEVLLRWRHPTRGLVSPTDFIPLAEETGAIVDIGIWVLRTACREAVAWPTDDKIAVNVSGVQLQHGDLAAIIDGILIETGLPPSRLEIEITETAIIKDKPRALHVLQHVRALGVTIAIDDFGIGYSSLETLLTFPFDKIKLDRSFTSGLAREPQATAIVRAVISLGKSLKIRVLAEGVETDQQLLMLRLEGCDEAQGYYLGRPNRSPDLDRPVLQLAPLTQLPLAG